MLKKIFDNTNTITSRIASISINLVVIGISAVLLLGAVDTLRTKFKKSKKNKSPREQLDKEQAEQCADYAEKDVSLVEEAKESFKKFNKELDNGTITFDDKEGTVKKNLKKKGSSKSLNLAEVDNPEDLPAPNTESQE